MAKQLGMPENGEPLADLYLHVRAISERIDALLKNLSVNVKDLRVDVSVYDGVGNFIANGSGTATGHGRIQGGDDGGGATIVITA